MLFDASDGMLSVFFMFDLLRESMMDGSAVFVLRFCF